METKEFNYETLMQAFKERQASEGIKLRNYCAEVGVNYHTMVGWIRRRKREKEGIFPLLLTDSKEKRDEGTGILKRVSIQLPNSTTVIMEQVEVKDICSVLSTLSSRSC